MISSTSQIVYNFTTSSAIVIGGVWAYFKFIRGRTFSCRAELSINSCVERSDFWLYLNVTVEFRNTGLSKLPLRDDLKYLQLFGMIAKDADFPGATEWKLLITQKIFDQHDFIEAQEKVTDTAVLRLHRTESTAIRYTAYKAEVWLGTPQRRVIKKGHLWHARAIAFAPLNSTEELPMIFNGSRSLISRMLERKNSRHEQRR